MTQPTQKSLDEAARKAPMTNPKHTSSDLVERFSKFLEEWGKSRQYGEVIYGLHVGTDREVELTATSICDARDRIEALEAEVERLREALAHYAAWGVVCPLTDDAIRDDGGDIARAALKEDTRHD